jgi:SSS family solute:Na+ symporter
LGIQVVVGALGVTGTGIAGDLPLIIAFAVLAAFTYSSGLRAPASIAIVKDTLIYIATFAIIIVVPIKLGGFGKIFAAVPAQKMLLAVPGPHTTGAYGSYATLALGSALALFLYPHSMTAILSASSGAAIRRNAAILPGYSFCSAARDGRIIRHRRGHRRSARVRLGIQDVQEQLRGAGAHPARVSFLVRRRRVRRHRDRCARARGDHVHRGGESVHAQHPSRVHQPQSDQQARVADGEMVSLIAKLGALVFIIFVPTKYAIQLQLLGGIWIIQTLPAVMLGCLYALVQRLGVARGLGGGHIRRHRDGRCLEPGPHLHPRFRRV